MRIASLAFLCGLLAVPVLLPVATAADTAPDFTLRDMSGKKIRLSSVYKQGPVLLTFWSTWCKNCPEEMKHFQRFYDEYKDQGFTVLAISIDTNKTLAKVRPWIVGRRLSCPVLLDTNNNVKRSYKVGPVPHSFLIDRNGKIAFSHVGYRAGDEKAYQEQILKLLNAKQEEEDKPSGEEKPSEEKAPTERAGKEAQGGTK